MTLHRPDVVSKPFGDLVDRNTRARQQACEGMPHDMRRHPSGFLCLHIEVEWSSEIPTIYALSSRRNLRMKHIRLVKPKGPQKYRKFLRQWNRPLFSVLELNPFMLAQMEEARLQIKPRRFCLHNFVKSQAGMKTAVQARISNHPSDIQKSVYLSKTASKSLL